MRQRVTARTPLSNPGVRFPPPFIFAVGFLIGWFVDRRGRGLPLSGGGVALARIGFGILIVGVGLAAWGIVTFRRARTAVIPHHAASQLVASGPYRFTRNPMYVGLTIVYIGGAVVLNSAWPLILLPVVLIVLAHFVVVREEQYLNDAFGDEYAAYRSRVRRWL
jgi:protein-S-isoprenylcysteine O-methyltransferase Ste14